MSLKLVKTIGGDSGTPNACKNCKSIHFIRAGNAWYCGSCGLYYPATFALLEENFNQLKRLHGEIRQIVDDLEKEIT
jgi:hypothetical protein